MLTTVLFWAEIIINKSVATIIIRIIDPGQFGKNLEVGDDNIVSLLSHKATIMHGHYCNWHIQLWKLIIIMLESKKIATFYTIIINFAST